MASRTVLTDASWEDPARLQRVRHLADACDERAGAEFHLTILGEVPHAIECVRELLGELCADLVPCPEEPAEVLHPLEVRDRDAAGVREDVREHRDSALPEDLVGLERRRP